MDAIIKIKDVTRYLETLAPVPYQESYDNTGLLTGDFNAEVKGILVSLDCTEEVIAEAIESQCNLVIAHHPIIFKGLKRLTGANYVERTIIQAIKNDVAIYAIHTNLDNIQNGVNQKICEKIGLNKTRILAPKEGTLNKLVTFIPRENVEPVMNALYEAGAGQIGKYKNCSFQQEGHGTFMPTEGTNPYVGQPNTQELVTEVRAEVIFPSYLKTHLLNALRKAHPYEEVAYYISSLLNDNQEVGSGMIGELDFPMEPLEFLQSLKDRMELSVIRYTSLLKKKVHKIAVCGGSGGFLLPKAIQQGADIFISADYKYHEFFDADKKIIIADIGHYESEVFTKELLVDVLMKKFRTFAINFSKTHTNPISYL
jgi:dinuclear metal center YbgI/SA1388 family protein